MSLLEKVYIGACLGTDGCAYYSKTKSAGSNKGWRYTLDFGGEGELGIELVSNFLRMTGAGSVYHVSNTKPNNFWKWTVGARNTVYDIIEQVAPFSVKAQKMLAVWQ